MADLLVVVGIKRNKMEGEAVWLRIMKAVEELLSEERPKDAEVH